MDQESRNDRIAEIFSLFGDQEGKLCVSRLGDFLRALGHDPSERQIRDLTTKWDGAGRGVLERDVVTGILNGDRGEYTVDVDRDELIRSLGVFAGPDGKIEYGDMVRILTTMGEKMEAAQVLEVLGELGIGEGECIDCRWLVDRLCL